MNMPKQVKISATEVAANEVTKPQVINITICGGRRYDAETVNGTLEGVIILFREPIPAIIDGERKDINKKWFAATTLVDALIMSTDDNAASKVANVLDGDYMSLRGLKATVTVFTDDSDDLHYKLEF